MPSDLDIYTETCLRYIKYACFLANVYVQRHSISPVTSSQSYEADSDLSSMDILSIHVAMNSIANYTAALPVDGDGPIRAPHGFGINWRRDKDKLPNTTSAIFLPMGSRLVQRIYLKDTYLVIPVSMSWYGCLHALLDESYCLLNGNVEHDPSGRTL